MTAEGQKKPRKWRYGPTGTHPLTVSPPLRFGSPPLPHFVGARNHCSKVARTKRQRFLSPIE